MELHSLMIVQIIGCQRVRGQLGVLITIDQGGHNYHNKPQSSDKNPNILTFGDVWWH